MNLFKIILQIVLLAFLFSVGNLITKYLHIPIPGSIVGLVILFLLLQFKVIKVEWIEKGASWLLAELLLFFIPAAAGVINYQQAIGPKLGKLLVVIFLSTLTVMAFTGLTAQFIAKRRKGGSSGNFSENH
ncbi:MAG: CidA/LrgA family protein [Bacillota bacterium]|nr:CidA/LrgA family protein [Bacillota bacterium]